MHAETCAHIHAYTYTNMLHKYSGAVFGPVAVHRWRDVAGRGTEEALARDTADRQGPVSLRRRRATGRTQGLVRAVPTCVCTCVCLLVRHFVRVFVRHMQTTLAEHFIAGEE